MVFLYHPIQRSSAVSEAVKGILKGRNSSFQVFTRYFEGTMKKLSITLCESETYNANVNANLQKQNSEDEQNFRDDSDEKYLHCTEMYAIIRCERW